MCKTCAATGINKAIEIYKENEYWLNPKETILSGMDLAMLPLWYKEYVKLAGRKNIKTFSKCVAMFHKITMLYWIAGDSTKDEKNLELGTWKNKQEAWDCIAGYLKSYTELKRIFASIDNITNYS